jgi:hypothetical protein
MATQGSDSALSILLCFTMYNLALGNFLFLLYRRGQGSFDWIQNENGGVWRSFSHQPAKVVLESSVGIFVRKPAVLHSSHEVLFCCGAIESTRWTITLPREWFAFLKIKS